MARSQARKSEKERKKEKKQRPGGGGGDVKGQHNIDHTSHTFTSSLSLTLIAYPLATNSTKTDMETRPFWLSMRAESARTLFW